jgi:myo-inositol-1-phosphate synthase
MLKVLLGSFFRRRNIHIDGWYSTNILGNNDGRILMLPEHRVIKLHDKSDSLGRVLGYDDFSHVVTIDYFPPHGDRKESWDAVEGSGWLGNKISLRINWRSDDSLLAAPMILDLARFCSVPAQNPGIQPHFGFYFKHPLGVSDYSLDTLYSKLEQWALHHMRID